MLCLSGFELYSRWVPLINSTQKLKLCFILKKGQYFKDNIFLGFINPYRRQVFPREKEGSTINQ